MMRVASMLLAAGTPVGTSSTAEAELCEKAFARNELSAGKVYDFEGMFRATATNSTDTLTVRVRFGTSATASSNTACAAGGAVDVANDNYVVVRGRLHVLTPTKAIMVVSMNDPGADATALKVYTEILTIAADTAYFLNVTGQMSVSNAGNAVQAECFTVLEVA